ncbi:MAG TPA: hypothetical protein VGG61_10940 [Gemmataceae bacterium]|jgi:hypothetical protein
MTAGAQSALTYLKLSEWFNQKGQPQQRDRFLVLAADAAQAAGRQDDAEKLRMRLLKHNPHHLLRPYSSFAQALSSADVQSYVNDLRNSYPPNKAVEMLASASSGPNQPAAQPKPLPPTQPVVDLDAEAASSASKEPLKVYRAKDDSAPVPKTSTHGYGERARTTMPPTSARRQEPPLATSRPTTTARPAAPARPTVSPPVYSLAPEQRPQPTAWKETRHFAARGESAGTGWVETSLFVLVLAVGVAMSLYALAGPVFLGR